MLWQEQTAAFLLPVMEAGPWVPRLSQARVYSHPSLCDEGLSPARALRAGAVSSEGRCSDSACVPRLSSRRLAPRLHRLPDWLCSRACGGIGVSDALPQRNCGRFARPSLLLQSWMKELQATAQNAPLHCLRKLNPLPLARHSPLYVLGRSRCLLFHIIKS
jgi:hypothetical protein